MTKYALCIGINNYPGTHMDLAGCVNDANDWAAELGRRGFAVSKLIDSEATKAAMVAGFKSAIGDARNGDLVVITYSGHGTYVPDVNGDELDGLDEALCPYDVQTNGSALVDDEIHAIFGARGPGVRVVLISDSCHSGTVTRAAAADPDADDVPRPRFMPMGNWLPADKLPRGASGKPLPTVAVTSGLSPFATAMSRAVGDLLLAGCKEGPNNFSYDARIKGRPNGAFTYYALKALKALPPGASYAQWMSAINPVFLPSASYPQSPQIFGSADAKKREIFS
jgi:metacaspase-1